MAAFEALPVLFDLVAGIAELLEARSKLVRFEEGMILRRAQKIDAGRDSEDVAKRLGSARCDGAARTKRNGDIEDDTSMQMVVTSVDFVGADATRASAQSVPLNLYQRRSFRLLDPAASLLPPQPDSTN